VLLRKTTGDRCGKEIVGSMSYSNGLSVRDNKGLLPPLARVDSSNNISASTRFSAERKYHALCASLSEYYNDGPKTSFPVAVRSVLFGHAGGRYEKRRSRCIQMHLRK
jgi:hypothetical protein